jgi:hypothetical protein
VGCVISGKHAQTEDQIVKKALLAAAAISMAAAGIPAWARHHSISEFNDGANFGWPGEGGGFSAATLSGTYIFEAQGNANGAGSVAIVGTLVFDGVGTVTGNLVVTSAIAGQQVSCADTFPAALTVEEGPAAIAGSTSGASGTYTITPSSTAPGLGTMTIPVGSGLLNFALLVPRAWGVVADVIENDNGSLMAGSVCTGGTALTSLALVGHLRAVPTGDWH